MTRPGALGLAIAFVIVTAPRSASADDPAPPAPRVPYLVLPAPRTLCKPAETAGDLVCRQIPAGRYLDEPAWIIREAELVRLQTAETRLTAENKSLRKATEGWQPGWRTLAVTLATGFAGGLVAYHYFDR